jgi:hypothetical protein
MSFTVLGRKATPFREGIEGSLFWDSLLGVGLPDRAFV